MDGFEVDYASMSVLEAEQFVKEGNELIAKMNADPEKFDQTSWLDRRNRAVVASLNKAKGETEWTIEKLKSETDLVIMKALFDAILEWSGLKPGEVPAASVSPRSAAA